MVPVHVGQYDTHIILEKWGGRHKEEQQKSAIEREEYAIAVSDGLV